MAKEIVTKARVLDRTHLELDESLPEGFEPQVKVHISPLHPEQNRTLHEQQAVYQAKVASKDHASTDDKQAVIAANRFIVEHQRPATAD